MSQNMTDEELDRDWKPNGRRPQSTVARSFSAELMDIFRIEESITDLDSKLDQRKHNVQSQTTELESLEKRIREMEDRLKRGSTSGHPRPSLPIHQGPGAEAAPSSQDAAASAASAAAPALPEKSRSRPDGDRA